MAIKFKIEENSIAIFNVSDKLGKAELEQAQNECESAIQKLGNIKILVVLDNFTGWEKAEGWEDMSFAERNDPYIAKIAIVGDEKWRDSVYMFTARGLRPTPIEYFDAGQAVSARKWLDSV